MKIKWQGFLAQNHSWSIVAQNISRQLIKFGHDVDLISTNGLENFPEDLKPYLKSHPGKEYDVQLSYTAMKNFPDLLNNGSKNRFGIWCYEFAGKNSLPQGFAKHYRSCDKLLPPSNFAKQVFMESGIPESHMEVVSHGINRQQFDDAKPMDLGISQRMRILANIAQPHIRKNIRGLLTAYGQAFTKKDDVCLVLKVSDREPKFMFEVSFSKELKFFRERFPNHAAIKVMNDFLPDIAPLYRACNVTFTLSRCEGYWVPGLEGLAANHIVIAPRHGGQLDYLSNQNSLLIDGKEIFAPPQALYYEMKTGTKYFDPSIDSAVKQLKNCYDNFDTLGQSFDPYRKAVVATHDWQNVVDKILSLVK